MCVGLVVVRRLRTCCPFALVVVTSFHVKLFQCEANLLECVNNQWVVKEDACAPDRPILEQYPRSASGAFVYPRVCVCVRVLYVGVHVQVSTG